jgi:hypothetical protein
VVGDTSLDAGTVVVLDANKHLTTSSTGYDNALLGVVDTAVATSTYQVSIAGNQAVKVTNENGPIEVGDYLTTSEKFPGYAMKATRSGRVLGQALSSFTDSVSNSYGIINVRIDTSYAIIDNHFVLNGSMQPANGVTSTVDSTYLIDQKGSGNILNLQAAGINRFMVASTGSVLINASTTNLTDNVLTVKALDKEVVTINARGDLALAGVITIKDDSYAGSITTNSDGFADIDFTNDLGTGKPAIELTVESTSDAFARIVSFKMDAQGRYTGFTMKSFNTTGSGVSVTVHYLVIAKPNGYNTSISNLPVLQSPGQISSPSVSVPDPGTVSGTSTPPSTTDTGSGTSTPPTDGGLVGPTISDTLDTTSPTP